MTTPNPSPRRASDRPSQPPWPGPPSPQEIEDMRFLRNGCRGCFWTVFLLVALFFFVGEVFHEELDSEEISRERKEHDAVVNLAKARTDLRQLRSAIEAYAADHGGAYPPMAWNSLRGDTAINVERSSGGRAPLFGTLIDELPTDARWAPDPRGQWGSLTTPIAYHPGPIPLDAFRNPWGDEPALARGLDGRYLYWNLVEYRDMLESGRVSPGERALPPTPSLERLKEFEEAFGAYLLLSRGPSRLYDWCAGRVDLFRRYDPPLAPDGEGTIYVSQKGGNGPAWILERRAGRE
jgi:hypothetical protein